MIDTDNGMQKNVQVYKKYLSKNNNIDKKIIYHVMFWKKEFWEKPSAILAKRLLISRHSWSMF